MLYLERVFAIASTTLATRFLSRGRKSLPKYASPAQLRHRRHTMATMKILATSRRMLETPRQLRDGEEMISGDAADLIRSTTDNRAKLTPFGRVSSLSQGFGSATKIERMCKQFMSSPRRFLGDNDDSLIQLSQLPEVVGNKRHRTDSIQRSAKKRKGFTSKKISPSEEAQNLFGPLERTAEGFSPPKPFSPRNPPLCSKPAPLLKPKNESAVKKKSLEEKLKDVVVPSPLRSVPALRSAKPEPVVVGSTSEKVRDDDKRKRRKERRPERSERDSPREGRAVKVEKKEPREESMKDRDSPNERRRRERRAERWERDLSRERRTERDSSRERRGEKYGSKYMRDDDESPFSRRRRDRPTERDSSRERRARSDRSSSRELRGRSDKTLTKERRARSDYESSGERRGRSERSSSRERRVRSEQDPPRERRVRSERDQSRERRRRSERSPSRERRVRSERSPSRERRVRSDRSPSRERRIRSERSSSRERRARSERSSSKERRSRSGKDSSKERRGRSERDVSRERRPRSEIDSSKERRARSERSSSRERRARQERESSRERRRKSDVDLRDIESPNEKRERRGDRYERDSKSRRSDKSEKDLRENDSSAVRRKRERRSSRAERDSSVERRVERNGRIDGSERKSVRARNEEKAAKETRKSVSGAGLSDAGDKKVKERGGNGREAAKSKSVGTSANTPNGREGIRSRPAPTVVQPPPLVSAPAPPQIPLSKPAPPPLRSSAAPTGFTSRPRLISKPLPNGNGAGPSTEKTNMVLAKAKTSMDYRKEYGKAQEMAQKEWDEKKYEDFERHAIEATKICFEWALCREKEFRRREKEMRSVPKKLESEVTQLRDHYNWITRKVAKNHIQKLTSIKKTKGADTLKRLTNKSYLRLSMLTAQWNNVGTFQTLTGVLERTMKANASNQGDAKINPDAVLSDREARSLHKVVKEYANVLEIFNRVISDTGTGVQEPGTECTIQ